MVSIYAAINATLSTLNNYVQNRDKGKASPDLGEKSKALRGILQSLQDARPLYVDSDAVRKLYESIHVYLINDKITGPIKRIISNIETVVKDKKAQVAPCFDNKIGQQLNLIIDKCSLTTDEYRLLYKIGDCFIFQRLFLQRFFQLAALKMAIIRLRKENPRFHFKVENSQISSSFEFSMPEDSEDAQFIVKASLANWRAMKSVDINDSILYDVIDRKERSSDPSFKEFLGNHLASYQIDLIFQELVSPLPSISRSEALALLPEGKAVYEGVIKSVCPMQPHFNEVCTNMHNIFQEEYLADVQRDLFKHYQGMKGSFDEWYSAIYEKIVKHKGVDINAQLLSMEPKAFADTKFEYDFNTIPVVSKIRTIQEEIRSKIRKEKKEERKNAIKARRQHPQSQKTKEPKTEMEGLRMSIPEEKEPLRSEASISAEPQKRDPQAKKKERTDREYYRELNEASSFKMDEQRVLAWFGSTPPRDLLTQDSPFVHNFALAVNDILFLHGARYVRQSSRGEHQPAIVMLCQVDHAMYQKPTLFIVTTTFSACIEPTSSLSAWDKSWCCYHRTLSKREQNHRLIDDYVAVTRDLCVDFPPLPSQVRQLQLSDELINKTYPDGSYIEKIEGSVVTICDPKHDQGHNQCRIHLFCSELSTAMNGD